MLELLILDVIRSCPVDCAQYLMPPRPCEVLETEKTNGAEEKRREPHEITRPICSDKK